MAGYEGSSYAFKSRAGDEVNAWAVGFIFFGSVMMVILGSFHAIAGMTALFDDSFYAVRPGFALEIDVTAWGWIHLIGGIVLGAAGLWLLTGSAMARYVTIALASLSALWNFYSIPYYPIWSILMLVLCAGVLWALIAHGGDFSKAMTE